MPGTSRSEEGIPGLERVSQGPRGILRARERTESELVSQGPRGSQGKGGSPFSGFVS